MDSSHEFTIPLPFDQARDTAHTSSYGTPQHLIPSKVHSCTGNVTGADSLTSSRSAEQLAACTLSSKAEDNECTSVILDYGVAVAGIPVLCVDSLTTSTSPVILDMSFSEGFPGIVRTDGDGPFPFSAGADTQRRTRFRIRGSGFYDSAHVQGSQRWLKITLMSPGPCSLSLSLVGFKPVTSNIPVSELPGSFQCSDAQLSALWGYGARTVQLNCVPPRTVPPPWQVSEDMGILIDSQRCNAYGWGGNWTDYDFEVDGMVIENGLAWSLRVSGGRAGFIFQINLRDDKAIIEMWYGYYDKPQITLIPVLMSSKPITEIEIVKGRWYHYKAVCIGTEIISVFVDDIHVATFNQAGPELGSDLDGTAQRPPTIPKGSVGIGAGQDQVCRFRDMRVTAMPSGKIIYTSGLRTTAALADFGIGWNQLPYIFDGAKRDRFAWTADMIIGGPSVYYSTAASEHIRGNIEASILRSKRSQSVPALLPGGVPPGREFEREFEDTMFNVLSVNYSLYLTMVIYDYWMYTGDELFLRKCWVAVRMSLLYIEALVNDHGLVDVDDGMDAMDYDYYNGKQIGISTKRNVLYVSALRCCAKIAAEVMDDETLSSQYLTQASRTVTAINTHLFNETGHYNITSTRTIGFQQETHGWLLYKAIAPQSLHSSLVSSFTCLSSYDSQPTNPSTSDLELPRPPLSFSQNTPDISPVISPIMSAFHILGLLSTSPSNSITASSILRTVWGPMCDTTSPYFTGTTWEFLTPAGTPFKDQFCSYAQLFSAGPTFILSQYVLGVEPVSPGYKEFKVHPRFEIQGVDWVQGVVPTPASESIIVRWQRWEGGWRLRCRSPRGLRGVIIVPENVWRKKREVMVNGKNWGVESCEIVVGYGGLADDVDVLVLFEQRVPSP